MLARILSRAEETIISLLLVAMTLLVLVEVVLRFGFNTGLLWAQELTLHLSAWFVLFGVSYGVKVGAHIGVDALVRTLPSGLRRIVGMVAVLLCLVYCALFLYGSWVYLEKMHMFELEMEDLPILKWQSQSILIIGFALLALRFVQLLWQIATGKADGFKLADEAEESMHLAEETQGADAVSTEEKQP